MIAIFDCGAQDFDTNGLGVLQPSACEVSRELNGMYEVTLTHPMDESGKWKLLALDRVLRVPVPEDATPALKMAQSATQDIYRVSTSGSRLRLRSRPTTSSKILGSYRNGSKVVLVEKTSGSWYRVTAPDGATGYMSASYLRFDHTETAPVSGKSEEIVPKPVRPQPFRIYRIAPGDGTMVVNARHIFWDLANDVALEAKAEETTCQQAMDLLISKAQNPESPFTFYSDIVDTKTAEWEYAPITDAILGEEGIVETWGAEIMCDWYDVYLVDELGQNRGVTIRRGKNLTSIGGYDDASNVVTRVIPIGKNSSGNPLFLPEKYVDSEKIADYPHPRVEVLQVSEASVGKGMNKNQAYEKMREAAQDHLKEKELPERVLEISFVDLSQMEEYKDLAGLQNVYMGDTVTILDEVLDIRAEQRVTRYTYDALAKQYISVTLTSDTAPGFGQKISRRQLPDDVVNGRMLAWKAVSAANIDETVGQSIIATSQEPEEPESGQLWADSTEGVVKKWEGGEWVAMGVTRTTAIEAVIAKIQNIISNQLTTDELYAGIATIAQAELTTANIEKAEIEWAEIERLSAAVGEIAKARIGEATISTAQIDDLSAVIAEAMHLEAAVGEFGLAEVKNLLSGALIVKEALAGNVTIENLVVTSANMLESTVDKLVVKGEDGKYYRVQINSGGAIATEEVAVSPEEIEAGQTGDGRQIVGTTANVRELNATTVKASQAILGQILTECLTAGAITAGEALITSATIPALYVTAIRAIGESIDISANSSITLLAATAGAYRVEIETTANVLGEEHGAATMAARVYWKDEEVTDSIAASGFQWTRRGGDWEADALWNAQHQGMKSVTVTSEEIASFAVFECAVEGDWETAGRVSVVDGYVDGDGYLFLKLSNGTEIGCGRVRGEQGPKGEGLRILGAYQDLAGLLQAHPAGSAGDAYMAAGRLWAWTDGAWADGGDLKGPKGDTGAQGIQGPRGIQGLKGETGAQGPKGDAGAVFTPSVSEAGVLSWENDGGLENPGSVKVQGPQGEPGQLLYATFEIEIAEGELWMNTPEGYRGPGFELADGYLEVVI